MALELVFLGTGTSAGVPMIGCTCPVCTSPDPRNRRHRASALVRYPRPQSESTGHGGDRGLTPAARLASGQEHPAPPPVQMLIDASPELRQQIIRADVHHLDGVFFTHAHADHIFGLDDLRRFNVVMDRAVDLYAEPPVAEQLRSMFRYAFDPASNVNDSFVPQLLLHAIAPGASAEHLGARWTPIRLMHGRLPIVGYRVDWRGASLAYCTDVSSIPPESYELLQGVDVLVIDALRYRHHPTHMTVEQALDAVDALTPGRAYLTHIAHEIDHATLSAELPDGVFVAHDELVVEVGTSDGATRRRSDEA